MSSARSEVSNEMTFTDDLTLVLDLLVLVTCAVFYTGVTVWYNLSRGDLGRARAHLREGSIVMGGLGGLLGVFALWGEFTWPLFLTFGNGNVLAPYDILFFDSLTMLAFLLVAFAVAVNLRLPTHMVGVLGIFIGAAIFFYGYRAYNLSLTLQPLETFLMYLAFGGVAILSYPATLFVDLYVVGPQNPEVQPFTDGPKPSYPVLWSAVAALFLVIVVLAGIAAIAYGYNTAWGHLANPP